MTVEIRGLDEVVRKLEGLDDPAVFRPPMIQATAHIQRKLADYPAARRRPQPFKSDRQRRFFFAALREGRIQVPYRRTGTLGRRWTTEVSADGRRGVVGNNTPYAPLVQGPQQAAYHSGNWQTTAEVARDEERAVVGFFEAALARYAR
jgi:hypothetical protein